jgi:hypothetical protein
MRYIVDRRLLQVYFDRSDFEIWEEEFLGPHHHVKEHIVRYHWVVEKCRILHSLIHSNFENHLKVEIHDEYFFLYNTVTTHPGLHAASYDNCICCDMHYDIDLCPKWEPYTQYINDQWCRDSGNESDSEVNEHPRGLEMNWLTCDKL